MFRDRVEQTTLTSGVGSYTLDGTVQGKRTFATAFAHGDTIVYAVVQGNLWECNEGVLDTGVSPPRITRARLIVSSTGSAINWPDATAKQIFNDVPAELLGMLLHQLTYAVAAGSANALTAAVPVPFGVFRSGAKLWLRITATNTAAAALVVTAGGVAVASKPIQKAKGIALSGGELVLDSVVPLSYDSAADAYIIDNGINIATGQHVLPIRAVAMRPSITNGAVATNNETTTNKVGYFSFDFDPNTKWSVTWEISMPPSYDGGAFQFRVKWTALSGSGGVAFSLQILARQDDDPLDTAYGTAVVVTDTLTAVGDDDFTVFSGNVTPAGTALGGKTLYFKLAREVADAGDTLAALAKVINVDLRFNTKAGNDA